MPAVGEPMAKKKASTDRHDPDSLNVRLEPEYRAALVEITDATHRSFTTEVRLALDKHIADMRAKIAAGHFSDGK